MRIIWELADFKPGTKVKKPLGDERFAYFVLANAWRDQGYTYGIFHISDGEFITVGNGSQDAVISHLNLCGFKPMDVQ